MLVHGLFGHPKNSWSVNTSRALQAGRGEEVLGHENLEESPRKKPRNSQRELFHTVFWPQDLLPIVFPGARILTWGYDAQVEQLFSSVSKASLLHHAESLLSDLARLRTSTSDKARPIFFVAHSLGGIVIKDALSLSRADGTFLGEIFSATRGVVFLGTPHHGSKVASLGKIACQLMEALGQKPNTQILRSLERNSDTLERISRSFGQILATEQLKVHSFREELDTMGVRIVDSFSSTIGYFKETRETLHANHRNMAKFSSVQDVNFQRVVSVLRRWIDELGQVRTRNGASAASNKDILTLPDGLIFDEQYDACLKFLNHADARKRVKDVELAHSGTYDWLLNDSIGFNDWLKGDNLSPVFWVQGKPGSGKSTLMKFALNHASTLEHLNMNSKGHWIVASYFFHDRGTTIQKSVDGFLGEILFQVLKQQRELFPLIYPILTQWDLAGSVAHRGDKDSSESLAETWSIEDMKKALMLIATESSFETNICLFVDALDEHDGNHRELISTLKHFAHSTRNPFFRLRLCLAGRPENVFSDAFQSYPGFAIHEHTTQDIRLYAEERIQKEMGSKLTDKGVDELKSLVQNIIERAKGVFLWVRLVVNELIDGLCAGDDIEELRHSLSTIPTELEELYTRAIRRARPTSSRRLDKHRIEVYIMFQIVLHAKEPFSFKKLVAATLFLVTEKDDYRELPERLSDDQMRRRLNSRSAGLLEMIDDELDMMIDKVQFIHQTAKEFMLTSTGSMVLLEDLRDPPKDSGFLLIFRYLLSLLKNFKPYNESYVCELIHYAEKVDSETGRSAGQYLEPAFCSLTDQQRYEFLRCIIKLLRKWSAAIRCFLMDNRRQVQIAQLFIFCGLHRSLGEYVSSHISEFTDEDSFHLFKSLDLDTWIHDSYQKNPPRSLWVLLENGLGAKLSFDAFISIDISLEVLFSRHSSSNEFYSVNKNSQELWEKLREEKTPCI